MDDPDVHMYVWLKNVAFQVFFFISYVVLLRPLLDQHVFFYK